MAMYKPPALLLLLTLFLSSAFLSLAFHLRTSREEVSELLTESNPESPWKEYEHCQQRCQEELGDRRQEQCQQQCEQRIREREHQEEEDPPRRYEQCQQRCHRQHSDRRQQRQCQQMCQREYEERQEEEERRRDSSRDPRQRYEQCRERCERQQHDQRQQQHCQQRCQEEYEERQEEERRRDNYRDPRQRYEQCRERCERQEHDERRQQRCQQRCQMEYEEERQEEEERLLVNSRDHRQQYEQCRERCEGQQHDQRQQQHCQQRCQREYEERQEEEKRHRDNSRDPRQRYEQCRERCERQQHDERRQQRCQRRCQSEYEEERPEEEERCDNPQDPRQQYEQCRERCQKQHQSQRKQQQCQRACREQLKEQEESCKSNQKQQSNNPFFIRSQWFESRFKAGQGHLSVLPKFNQRSPLLRGIENYRLSILEANPNTFVMPHHCNSESLFVVVRGQGAIIFVSNERRQSFNVKYGTIIRVPAGTTVYMVNSESDDKLIIASINEPVNAPGHFQKFFLSGGEKPRNYIVAFTFEILEASLNTTRDKIRKVFTEQRQEGRIRGASQEQLRALSAEASSSPRHSESMSPIELLNQRPLYSNENGRFHEACAAKFEQLRNMDVSISSLELKKGSIFLPHFNSKQTIVLLITEGSADIEMVAPQLRRQRQEEQEEQSEEEEEEGEEEKEGGQGEEEEKEQEQMSGGYQRVTARANPGDVFIILADHPVSLIASQNEDLKAIGFGINAKNNQRIFLAGRNNIVNNMEREAQELSFGVPARLVEQVFNNQKESHFASASQQRQQRDEEEVERENLVSSI